MKRGFSKYAAQQKTTVMMMLTKKRGTVLPHARLPPLKPRGTACV